MKNILRLCGRVLCVVCFSESVSCDVTATLATGDGRRCGEGEKHGWIYLNRSEITEQAP